MDDLRVAQLGALLDRLTCGALVVQLEDPDRYESLRILSMNTACGRIVGVEPRSLIGELFVEAFPHTGSESGRARDYRDVIVSQTSHDFGLIAHVDDRLDSRRFAIGAYPLGPDAAAILFDPLTDGAGPGVSEFEAIVQSAEDAILSKNLDGTILTWNNSAETIYGYTAAEAIGKPVSMLLPPERSSEVADILDRLRQGERIGQLETVRVRKDGDWIDVSLTVSPIIDPRGTVVGATSIARDMRGQKEAEARIRLLAEIVEASVDAILSGDLNGIVTSWNAGAERLFGYTAEEMIGTHIDVLAGEMSSHLSEIRHELNRGGQQRPVDLVMRRKDGSEIAVSSVGSPITEPSGALSGIAVVIRDVSEQRQLEEKLRQAQKLEAIGSLAGGIAHDFNNLLMVIRSAARLAHSAPDHDAARDKLAQIDTAAQHASALTTQLLAFSRQQVLQPEPTDLNSIVQVILDLLERLLGEGIRVSRRSSPDLQPVLIDRSQLQQVIMNLGVNARDAMPDGGELIVQTSRAVLDEDYAATRPEVTPGDYALLEITDTGTGIEPERQARIFDPFFTTKATGTGLGLATVYGIVKQSGGHIAVYSEVGVGTTFKVYLPYANRQIAEVDESPASETVTGTETILLVDDNDMVRPLIREVLEGYGYTVLSARDGTEALAIAAEQDGNIDLLLTDVVMPGMTGGVLAETLAADHPNLAVLFTSGFPADTVLRHGIAEGRVSFIQKPFLGDELTLKIRSLLEQPNEP